MIGMEGESLQNPLHHLVSHLECNIGMLIISQDSQGKEIFSIKHFSPIETI